MTERDAERRDASTQPRVSIDEILKQVAAAIHDINNPLTFLTANHAVEQEHTRAFAKLVAALQALHDPRVNELLASFLAADRLQELREILVDNKTGYTRLQAIAKALRATIGR